MNSPWLYFSNCDWPVKLIGIYEEKKKKGGKILLYSINFNKKYLSIKRFN